MDRWYCDYVCGMAEGGGGGVRRDEGERWTWLVIGQQLGEKWLFHTSQCKALQVCSGRARELGTGSTAGSSS